MLKPHLNISIGMHAGREKEREKRDEMIKLIMEIFRQLFAAQISMHIKYDQTNRNTQNPQLNNMSIVRL